MTYPFAPLPVVVEFWNGTTWVDISAYTYSRNGYGIDISRGFPDEGREPEPGECSFELNNRDGRFSPRNPSGEYYGLIGRNTLVRVTVTGYGVRFVGEISEWPSRWDKSGRDVWVPVTAQGILRRLGQGNPAQSAIRRTVLASNPIAYWSLEDGLDSAHGGSAASGAAPMQVVGTITFAQDEDLPGSSATPDLSAGALFGRVSGGSSTAWTAEHWLKADFSATAVGRVYAGSDLIFRLFVPLSAGSACSVSITDGDGLLIDTLVGTTVSASFGGAWHHFAITAEQNGGNVDVNLYVDGALDGSDSFAGTLAAVSEFWANHQDAVNDDVLSASHFAVLDGTTPSGSALAGDGYAGETAADRADRLTTETGVPFALVGTAADTMPMGPQLPGTFLDVYNETWQADLALAYETRDSLGLSWRSRVDLYNQDVALTLDYTGAGEVAPDLEPTDDDQHLRNDVTVRRTNGSSARAVKETGPLSVNDPPDGVGRYDTEVELNLHTDDQTVHHAGWLLHLGTWDEARYPRVHIDMKALAAQGKTSLMTAAAALDVGDRIQITNPPSWLPPDTIDLMVLGFAETNRHPIDWDITLVCVPYSPYDIGTYESSTNTKRYDTLRSTTAEALDTTETGVDVTNDNVQWGTVTPYNIVIGGEEMTVTAISGTGASQTLTVTRSVNGVVKSHDSGVQVRLAPAHRAYRGL